MAKLPTGRFAKFALKEAKLGNPAPLIARLMSALQRSTSPLSDAEIWWIREALEATGGKRYADNLREIEQMLIAEQVEGYKDEGMKPKKAVGTVMDERERSRQHIYNAISAYKKRRRG